MKASLRSLTLHQLEIFRRVAGLGSYSRAAEALHLMQPTLSMQIRQLERAVGSPLFEFIHRKLYLTAAGEELYRGTQEALGTLEKTLESLEAMKGLYQGNLKVAADTTAGVYIVPPLLGRFHRTHPDIEIKMLVLNRVTVEEQLTQNQVDLAIMGEQLEETALEVEKLWPNHLMLVAPPHHRLVGLRQLALTELLDEPFLMREAGSGTRAAIEKFFAAHNIRIKQVMELSNSSAIKQAIMAGLGISVLPEVAIQMERRTNLVSILDVAGFPIERSWYVYNLHNKQLNPPAQAFRRLLRSTASLLDLPMG